MCNAHNHSFDCDCGFGGDTGGGGWRRGGGATISLEPVSAGWARDSRATVESYVNPNAHCPVCGEPVFFYRSPYDGRVFFDELGWPWPKHPCTDNSGEPRRTLRVSAPVRTAAPAWQSEGWRPLLSAKVYSAGDRLLVTGDFSDQFHELSLPVGERVDATSPVFIRARPQTPDIFELTFLRSDHFGTNSRTAIAFRSRIAGLGGETIAKAAADDPAAVYAIGSYILWRLDDPVGARPYLERAAASGIADAMIDLMIVHLFSEAANSTPPRP